MNKKISEIDLLNSTKGEFDSPFKIEQNENDDIAHQALTYLKSHHEEDYSLHKKKFVLMVEEIFPLNINQIVEWGEVSLREQKEIFQNCSLLINDYSSLNAIEKIESFEKKKKPAAKGFLSKIINTFKNSQEMEDRNEVDSLKNSLSILLPQIDQLNERLDNNYVRFRLMVLRAILESSDINNISLYEALDNRRQLFFYALQNIEISKKQIRETREVIVKQLICIDHIIKVTLPLLYRVDNNE